MGDPTLKNFRDREHATNYFDASRDEWVKRTEAVISNTSLNPLPVTFQASAGEVKNFYNEVSGVASGVSQTVITYTVPIGKTFSLKEIDGSSCNWSKFWVEIDGSPVRTKRTYTTDFNVTFNFFDLKLTEGQVVRLLSLHARTASAEVEGSIIGSET